MNPKEILIVDFDYDLLEERIATQPEKERDSSKLLIYKNPEISEDVFRSQQTPGNLSTTSQNVFKKPQTSANLFANQQISEDIFKNIDKYLPENSLLIFNNTRVVEARILFQKPTGAKIEIFLS